MSRHKAPQAQAARATEGKTVLLSLTIEEGAYCLTEFEMPTADLVKHARQIKRHEPDVFAIVSTTLTKRAREILGI